MSKSSLAAALAVLAAAGPAAAQEFAYKPGAQHYRLDQTVATTQTVQGMTQEAETSMAQFVSMELAPAAEGLGVTFVIDSVVVAGAADSAAPASPAQAQARAQAMDAAKTLRGRRLAGVVTPLGRVRELALVDTVLPNAQQLANGFRAFLVPFPSADVERGMTWTDTTTNEFKNMSGMDGTTKSVVTYTIVGDTTVHGQRAWRIEQKGTLTMSGAGAAQGTDVSLAGTGTVAGELLVAQEGVYLGGQVEQTQSLTVDVPAANMTIPITNKVTTRIQHVGHD